MLGVTTKLCGKIPTLALNSYNNNYYGGACQLPTYSYVTIATIICTVSPVSPPFIAGAPFHKYTIMRRTTYTKSRSYISTHIHMHVTMLSQFG